MHHSFGARFGPRQPVKEKGHKVYTDMSPDYDDSLTQSLVNQAVLDAIPAIESPDKIVAIIEKEKPMAKRPRKPNRLKFGEQGLTVHDIILENATIGQTITPTLVWYWFPYEVKNRWEKVYGSHDKAYGKVRHTMRNLNYSGKLILPIVGKGGECLYGGLGDGVSLKPVRKPISKPIEVPEVEVPVPEPKPMVTSFLARFTHIGTTLDGDPMFIDARDGEIGTIAFTPLPNTTYNP